jgi:hypothetical protein
VPPVGLGAAACGGAPGGADARRAAQVYPHGSTDALPYATMGSGSLNAMAVFEQGFREGLGRDDAVALVARAIRSGIFNDLGSGSNVDVCVITRGKARARRPPAIPGPAVRGRRARVPLLGLLRCRVDGRVDGGCAGGLHAQLRVPHGQDGRARDARRLPAGHRTCARPPQRAPSACLSMRFRL